MKKLFFFTFLSIFFISSCEKIGKETIAGSVLDDSTSVSLAGVEVSLYEFHDYSLSNAEFCASATTDNNGKFKMRYNLGRRNPYFLRYAKNGYYFVNRTIYESDDLENMNQRLRDM